MTEYVILIILTLISSPEDAPKDALIMVTPSGDIVQGSSVTLSCSSDANPAAKYTWYKDSKKLISKDPQLVFNTIQSPDSGEYHCIAENKLGGSSTKYIIKVKCEWNVSYIKINSLSLPSSLQIVSHWRAFLIMNCSGLTQSMNSFNSKLFIYKTIKAMALFNVRCTADHTKKVCKLSDNHKGKNNGTAETEYCIWIVFLSMITRLKCTLATFFGHNYLFSYISSRCSTDLLRVSESVWWHSGGQFAEADLSKWC